MELTLGVVGLVVGVAGLVIAYLQLRQDAPPKLDSTQPDVSQYLNFLIESYAYLDFKGIMRLERLSVRFPLEDVYVEPVLRPVASLAAEADQNVRVAGRDLRAEGLAEALGERMAQREESTASIDDVLAANGGVVILGEPGSGKSTALKALALRAARDYVSDPAARLPMVLPVAAYAEHLRNAGAAIGVADFMSIYLRSVRGFPVELADEFEAALDQGRALVLLDGLDEVISQDERVYVVGRVSDFLNWNLPKGNKFLITSRIVGYADAPLVHSDVEHFMLSDFSDGEIDAFLHKWTAVVETTVSGESEASRDAAAAEASRLSRAVFANPGVRRLASNPLLLTILVLIHRQGMELPRRRAELYEIYLNTLVNTWARARNLDGLAIGPMDELEVVKLLAPLAYWMHSERPAGTATREDLIQQAAAYYVDRRQCSDDEAQGQARETVLSLLQHSGLLTERGEGRFGFTHLSFQEFLAARHLVFVGQLDRQRTVELMVDRVDDAEWAEVIQLAVGYVGVVAKEEQAAAMLVGSLFDRAQQDSSLRVLLVGAECVADCGVEGVGVDRWEQTRRLLVEQLQQPGVQPSARRDVGTVLDALGDPRFDGDGPGFISIPATRPTIGTSEAESEGLVADVETVELPADSEWVRRYWRVSLLAELPQHEVDLDAFRIARYPITNVEYERFVAATGYPVPSGGGDRAAAFQWDSVDRRFPARRGNHPVVCVSWDDAMAYCEWLSSETGTRYRLPTEAEWECAARGTSGYRYPWGDEWDATRANTLDEGSADTVSVGCYPEGASCYGVEDCIGQVWEWTSTSWGNEWAEPAFLYPYAEDGRSEPEAAPWKVVRGGSWDDVGAFARCAARGPNLRDFRSHYIGFRIVQTDQ